MPASDAGIECWYRMLVSNAGIECWYRMPASDASMAGAHH
jgi:hypothetical protein